MSQRQDCMPVRAMDRIPTPTPMRVTFRWLGNLPLVWFCPEAPISNVTARNPGLGGNPLGGWWGNVTRALGSRHLSRHPLCCQQLWNERMADNWRASPGTFPNAMAFAGLNYYGPGPGANGSGNPTAQTCAIMFHNVRHIVNSSRVPVFADAVWHEAWPCNFGNISNWDVNAPNPYTDSPPSDLTGSNAWFSTRNVGSINGNYAMMSRFCFARHGQAINVCFFDGHSETVQLADLWSLQWSPMSAVGSSPRGSLPKQ